MGGPNTYAFWDEKLGKRKSCKIDRNTYVERCDEMYKDTGCAIVIRLHKTNVLTFLKNGRIDVNTGGWMTVTTKERINAFLPVGPHISQEGGVWYWVSGSPDWKTLAVFTDGDTISKGKLRAQKPVKADIKILLLRKQVKEYARLCAAAAPYDKKTTCLECLRLPVEVAQYEIPDVAIRVDLIPAPPHQDVRDEPVAVLGEFDKNTGHMLQHVKQSVVVPELVHRAMKFKGSSPAAFSFAWGHEDWGNMTDVLRVQIREAVKKYLYRQFKLVS